MDKNILHLRDDVFVYAGRTYMLDDFYTEDFYHYSNKWVKSHPLHEIYINILYVKVIQNILAIAFFLERNNIRDIWAEASFDGQLLSFVQDAAEIAGAALNGKKVKKCTFCNWRARFILFLSKGYLLLKESLIKQCARNLDFDKDVCVVRTAAARKKIKPSVTRELFCEDKCGEGSLYTYFSRKERRKALKKAYAEAKNQLDSIRKCMLELRMENTLPVALQLFSFRLVHICFYAGIIERLLSLPWKGRFFSGNNLDSYAFVEEQAARKAQITTVCIPHGLEYGFLFPHCFTGNIFYATSVNAAEHLNQIYDTGKFVYDPDIAKEMFCMSGDVPIMRKVVYFSEPREPEVNAQIIGKLLPEMKKRNIPLYLKRHPKDNPKEYDVFAQDIGVIEDLKEAVCGNICIARKSTVLLEGLYNNAACAAIVTNEKDRAIFSMFPSLQDKRIEVFKDIPALIQWIEDTWMQDGSGEFVDGK